MFNKYENTTILHTVSDETMEKVKRAHKATTEVQFVIDNVSEYVESLKASANKIRQEAFLAACNEFPALSDPNNPANLDFETGNVTTPKSDITDPIGQSLEAIQRILGGAVGGGDLESSIITGNSQEEILDKLRQKMEDAGIPQDEDEDDKKKVLN